MFDKTLLFDFERAMERLQHPAAIEQGQPVYHTAQISRGITGHVVRDGSTGVGHVESPSRDIVRLVFGKPMQHASYGPQQQSQGRR